MGDGRIGHSDAKSTDTKPFARSIASPAGWTDGQPRPPFPRLLLLLIRRFYTHLKCRPVPPRSLRKRGANSALDGALVIGKRPVSL